MRTTVHTLARLLIASSLSLPLAALAEPGGMPPHGGEQCGGAMPHGPMGAMGGMPMPGALPLPPYLHGIALSDAQEDKIFALLNGQAVKFRDLAKAARRAHDELDALAWSASYDEAKAKVLAEGGAKAMTELALLHARSEQQIRALLSAEQRQQVDERRSRHGAGQQRGDEPRRP